MASLGVPGLLTNDAAHFDQPEHNVFSQVSNEGGSQQRTSKTRTIIPAVGL